jgi:tellurite resistance protein
MNPTEKESILTLALMAGFADGVKNDAERAELKRIAQSLPQDGVQPAALYQRVLLKQVTLTQAAASLHTPELRQLAYEMAVCVCDADGAQTGAEKSFLADLRRALQLDPEAMAPFERSADALAAEPLAAGAVVAASAPRPAADTELDRMILNYAILNGALELMPESLATMAIIPLQMKMVYRIGKHHGHDLDRGHIKELSAIEMRQLFTSLTGQARDLHANYASAIRDKAGSLNLTQLLPIIRGQQ